MTPADYESIINRRNEIVSSAVHDYRFCVPYLCGYNTTGTVIYFDSHIPDDILQKYKKYLIVHEATEKAFLEYYKSDLLGLNKRGLGITNLYESGHRFATTEEKAVLEQDGYDWKEYSNTLAPFIHKADKEKLTSVPLDLDLEPYQDEHDKKILNEIKRARRGG